MHFKKLKRKTATNFSAAVLQVALGLGLPNGMVDFRSLKRLAFRIKK
jgi:hypothetical protein